MSSRNAPNRGDVVWLNFDPQSGHEQAGRRPALTLSPRSYNMRTGLGLFCPITSQRKGYPFEVIFPTDFQVRGVVLADQVKSLDWRVRKAEFLCEAPRDVIDDALGRLQAILEIE
ncbi:MAG: endoribonuclease MazF [Candidatus Hydrogenedentes bacterium]|nr:endoribonuclease MazF [Candidatus Hydrogenedentota bacterium]